MNRLVRVDLQQMALLLLRVEKKIVVLYVQQYERLLELNSPLKMDGDVIHNDYDFKDDEEDTVNKNETKNQGRKTQIKRSMIPLEKSPIPPSDQNSKILESAEALDQLG